YFTRKLINGSFFIYQGCCTSIVNSPYILDGFLLFKIIFVACFFPAGWYTAEKLSKHNPKNKE
ncbi:hypothetical protein PT274_04455, partial [Leuconostocaceae bacterium ESL0958]|nr:hypothetical protein [Leuconostocaceae bacterium ESL0958]